MIIEILKSARLLLTPVIALGLHHLNDDLLNNEISLYFHFMTKRALSIVTPAVANILNGTKLVEIRSWVPPELPVTDLVLVENARYLRTEGAIDPDGLARALVDVTAVYPWTREEAAAQGKVWQDGYFCWKLDNIRQISPPIPCVAKRGLYEVALNM